MIDLLLAAFLAGCAAVQYNDPDPLLWIVLYGAGSGRAKRIDNNRRHAEAATAAACFGLGMLPLGW